MTPHEFESPVDPTSAPLHHAWSLDSVAAGLNLPLSTLRKLINTGQGPTTIRLGRRLYVRHTDLKSWLDAQPPAGL